MIKSFFIIALLSIHFIGSSQQNDSLADPIIPIEKTGLLKNFNITFDMRAEFQAYTFRGGDNYYNGLQFENGFTALGITAKINDRLGFQFRNRFNNTSDVQSLDRLGSNIELAYINYKASPKLDLVIGKMFAYYGGYEYEFSALEILEYNDIYGNALAYVTGAGIKYRPREDHQFAFQVLNSRTILYEDLYGDTAAEGIEEPDWPVAVVANWRGSFFDGKLQTIYSASHSIEVKDKGTTFFTLGHKYENNDLTLMYDFRYSYEQIDTKGVITGIINDENVAENASYVENWLRAEYRFSSRFKGLLTLMTNVAYGDFEIEDNRARTSYGWIPTIYYSPFNKIDFRFYVAYIGRYYDFSEYAIENFGVSSYNKNEFRIGIITPLKLL